MVYPSGPDPRKGRGILTRVQRRVILAIAELQDSAHFYLTGGTALAEFYLGHRKSYDLDLIDAIEFDAAIPDCPPAKAALPECILMHQNKIG